MDERIEFELYQSCGNRGSVGRVLCLCCGCVCGVWVGGLNQCLEVSIHLYFPLESS